MSHTPCVGFRTFARRHFLVPMLCVGTRSEKKLFIFTFTLSRFRVFCIASGEGLSGKLLFTIREPLRGTVPLPVGHPVLSIVRSRDMASPGGDAQRVTCSWRRKKMYNEASASLPRTGRFGVHVFTLFRQRSSLDNVKLLT